ncbi:MAG: transglutaminase-like domain-containing protein, partial [Cellulosilyticaceae bacterium]
MVQPLVILGIVGFLLLAWLLIGWNKWTLVISSSVVVGTGIVGCIGLLWTGQWESVCGWLVEESKGFWLYGQQLVQGNIQVSRYGVYVLVLLGIGSTLWVYIWTVKKLNFSILLLTGGVIYGVQYLRGISVYRWGFNLLVLALLLMYFYSYLINLRGEREGGKELNKWRYIKITATMGTGIFLVSMGLAFYAPIKLEPLHRVLDPPKEMGATYYFPYAGKLGGDKELNDTVVMEVYGKLPAYLGSQYKEVYTGTGWETAQEEKLPIGRVYSMDTHESIWNVKERMQLGVEDVFQMNTLRITFKNICTPFLFLPAKVDRVQFIEGLPALFEYPSETVMMVSPQVSGFAYEIYGYVPRYSEEAVEETLRVSYKGIYTELAKDSGASELTILKERAQRIDDTYTQVPDTVPLRVKTLATTIVADATSDYDKAKAIEAYLADNYMYTLKPGSVPQGSDFVDYFLFEHKEGYCTYFASAMAVMTRCIGLPSRYIEGYTMQQTYKEDTGSYLVTNKEAHAWVEVYFEGFGWVPFEPTAPYNEGFRAGLDLRPDVLGRDEVNGAMDDVPELKVMQGQTFWKEVGVKGIGVLGGIGIIGGGILLGIKHLKRRRLSHKERLSKAYGTLLKTLVKKGYPLKVGCMLTDYAKDIDHLLETQHMSTCTAMYLSACYSEEGVDEEKWQAFQKEARVLASQLKSLKKK